MGIACTCDYWETVKCAFIFAKEIIAREISKELSIYLDYTSNYDCYYLDSADKVDGTTFCASGEYSDIVSC